MQSAWTAIEETFSVAGEAELQRVEEELESVSFDGSALSSITNLNALFHRLKAAGGMISENQKTLKLLKILPQDYSEVVKQIRTEASYRMVDKSYNFSKVVHVL